MHYLRAIVISAVVGLPMVYPSTASAGTLPDFETLDSALEYAESQFDDEHRAEQAVIVFRYTLAEGDSDERARVHFYSGSGFEVRGIKPNVYFVYRIGRYRESFTYKVMVNKNGYNEVIHPLKITPGEITIVDDIELHEVDAVEGSTVIGTVMIEGNESLEGIRVELDGLSIETDELGQFQFNDVAMGRKYVKAFLPHYYFKPVGVDLESGSLSDVSLEGYYKRRAKIRWAVQPDGSRNLETGLNEGEAIVGGPDDSRFSFVDGKVVSNNPSDFGLLPSKDGLVLGIIDRGKNGAECAKLKDISLDEVRQAPDTKYSQPYQPVREGDVFVFRTRGDHLYGKLEIVEILVDRGDKVPRDKKPENSD
ncbi:MAG TPA: hypothetical protein PKN33_16650 [Phycisphaerae bacterium]|nr:hypothetical protein [Phycisphaerae bacterium]